MANSDQLGDNSSQVVSPQPPTQLGSGFGKGFFCVAPWLHVSDSGCAFSTHVATDVVCDVSGFES